MLKFKGKTTCHFEPCIGIITRKKIKLFERKNYILISNRIGLNTIGYLGALTTSKIKDHFYISYCISEIDNNDIQKIHDGDLVELDSNGNISVVWTNNSYQNVLFLTESCNCSCLMCPQPPQKHDPKLINKANRILDLIYTDNISDICISGGEPTILKEKFIHILKRCITEHPESHIEILTNGKLFSNKNYADSISSIVNDNVTFCISLHSDISEIHDVIVNKKGSFRQTINGIYNLAINNCSIEIRIVINKLNYMDLPRIALHLANYIPFCVHYVFMGMEIHGLAIKNFDQINIFPNEYIDYLRNAVLLMQRRGLNVSVYNVPLCMCHKDIWKFAKKSISDWKNIHQMECQKCSVINECCGFFGTSSILPIKFINPIL